MHRFCRDLPSKATLIKKSFFPRNETTKVYGSLYTLFSSILSVFKGGVFARIYGVFSKKMTLSVYWGYSKLLDEIMAINRSSKPANPCIVAQNKSSTAEATKAEESPLQQANNRLLSVNHFQSITFKLMAVPCVITSYHLRKSSNQRF